MANTIEKETILQKALDAQMVQQSTSGWMEANAGQVIYNGGSEIKIPKMSVDGLANYDRDNGFTGGSLSYTHETRTLTMDRGRSFSLDAMTTDETNFMVNAGSVMAQFQSEKVIPEVDAYRYSKIASLAIAGGEDCAVGGYAPSTADIYSKIKADIAKIQDRTGATNLVVCMDYNTKNTLESSTEVSKQLMVGDFANGDFSVKASMIDGHPILTVPSVRFKTAYTFQDGKTTGQEAGGFVTNANSKSINWIIIVPSAPIAVSKTDNIRIFDPQTNQKANAWAVDYRKFHDLWIPDNKMNQLFVNVKEALA